MASSDVPAYLGMVFSRSVPSYFWDSPIRALFNFPVTPTRSFSLCQTLCWRRPQGSFSVLYWLPRLHPAMQIIGCFKLKSKWFPEMLSGGSRRCGAGRETMKTTLKRKEDENERKKKAFQIEPGGFSAEATSAQFQLVLRAIATCWWLCCVPSPPVGDRLLKAQDWKVTPAGSLGAHLKSPGFVL